VSAVDAHALDQVVRDVAAAASAVDRGALPAAHVLAPLARAGLLDAGIDDLRHGGPGATDLRVPAGTIAAIAGECLSSAFAVWAHRSVMDYLARGERSARTADLLDELRRAERPGSTAMAAGLKALAGVGELGIEARPDRVGWLLDGVIPWASNLLGDAVLVVPARSPGGTLVAWVPLGAPGLTVRPATGLLALDATASGSVRLEGVRIAGEQVISTDLRSFAQAFRPAFLLLQASFCAGLIRRSLQEAERALDDAAGTVFADEVRALGDDAAAFLGQWWRLAGDVTAAPARCFLELRLDASRLAQRATRLELTLAGGRGYLTASGANRRFREAAFLPVQSPSEGHLLWELSSLA